jgi:hypothetical protein
MKQNPYESPEGIELTPPTKTVLSPWLRKWGGPMAALSGLAGMIGMKVIEHSPSVPYPIWTNPMFGIFVAALVGGIIASVLQVGHEVGEYVRYLRKQ